jgi:PAS domain S-box-containing protein
MNVLQRNLINDEQQVENIAFKHEQQILNTSSIGVLITRIGNGIILYANKAIASLLGISDVSPVIGTLVPDFYWDSEDRNEILTRFRAEGSISNNELRARRADGSMIWVSISIQPFIYNGEQVLLSEIVDISKRKQTEEALLASQEQFRTLYDNATIGLYRTTPDGRILMINPTGLRLLGFDSFEELSKRNLEEAGFEQENARKEFREKLEREGVISELESEWTRKDGSTIFVREGSKVFRDGSGKVLYYDGSFEDITEQKRAEQALHRSEERFRRFTEVTIEGLVFHERGTIIDVNPAALAMFGIPDNLEFIGRNLLEFIQPESHQLVLQQMQLETVLPYEIQCVRNDGTIFPVETSTRTYKTGDQVVRASSITDITERKKLELQIQQAFERRGYQVQVSTEISQEVAAASEINDLFDRVVTLTRERLGYYHTQLLRYDPSQDAVVLISGYGETGQKMLKGGHKLPMGVGLIGTAAANGETVMRPNLANDPDWRPNVHLPETKGEIAVPIKWQNTILGVLDVQSNQADALTEDDRLLLEGLCGQIAVAMEQTRLRQEMAERLEEVNRLYQSMSREGWKTYRETTELPTGFIFDQTGTRPVEDQFLIDEPYINVPMAVLGGEVVGTLAVANDPSHPTSPEDQAFLRQVSDQIALALEAARLSAQTKSALAQTETLSEAGLRFARAADLQELIKIAVETLEISKINRAVLETFNYNSSNELDSMDIVANWWNGTGHEPTAVGTRYTSEILPVMHLFVTSTPIFLNDAFTDERVDSITLEIVKRLNIRSLAVLPLYVGTRQLGVMLLESEDVYHFKEDETRLFSAMGPQIATVLENRRQFARAQQQAERESMLNVISQKIQSATTVEAVLQIAARELGHALGAPMTIAQLNMKDKK